MSRASSVRPARTRHAPMRRSSGKPAGRWNAGWNPPAESRKPGSLPHDIRRAMSPVRTISRIFDSRSDASTDSRPASKSMTPSMSMRSETIACSASGRSACRRPRMRTRTGAGSSTMMPSWIVTMGLGAPHPICAIGPNTKRLRATGNAVRSVFRICAPFLPTFLGKRIASRLPLRSPDCSTPTSTVRSTAMRPPTPVNVKPKPSGIEKPLPVMIRTIENPGDPSGIFVVIRPTALRSTMPWKESWRPPPYSPLGSSYSRKPPPVTGPAASCRPAPVGGRKPICASRSPSEPCRPSGGAPSASWTPTPFTDAFSGPSCSDPVAATAKTAARRLRSPSSETSTVSTVSTPASVWCTGISTRIPSRPPSVTPVRFDQARTIPRSSCWRLPPRMVARKPSRSAGSTTTRASSSPPSSLTSSGLPVACARARPTCALPTSKRVAPGAPIAIQGAAGAAVMSIDAFPRSTPPACTLRAARAQLEREPARSLDRARGAERHAGRQLDPQRLRDTRLGQQREAPGLARPRSVGGDRDEAEGDPGHPGGGRRGIDAHEQRHAERSVCVLVGVVPVAGDRERARRLRADRQPDDLCDVEYRMVEGRGVEPVAPAVGLCQRARGVDRDAQ